MRLRGAVKLFAQRAVAEYECSGEAYRTHLRMTMATPGLPKDAFVMCRVACALLGGA